jgi:signal recognition particle GTPase
MKKWVVKLKNGTTIEFAGTTFQFADDLLESFLDKSIVDTIVGIGDRSDLEIKFKELEEIII